MSTPIITDDFPTGNIIVERIAGDEAWIRQDQRGSTTRWFYWHFAVHGAAGRSMTFHFTDWDVIGECGPAVSLDRGNSWTWLGRDAVTGQSFTYAFPDDADEVRFAFCIPYAQSNLREFLRTRPGIQCDTLCLSPQGRLVDRLRLGDRAAPKRIIITARHHACESAASFVLEGLLDQWLLSPPRDVALTAIPFVDKDGVENGDQGKNRHGHDHNRDYIARPAYPETAAIMAMVRDWPSPPLAMLDLHCPWIRGEWNSKAYVVGSSVPEMSDRQREFVALLGRCHKGELPFRNDDFLPHGTAWNTTQSTADSTNSSHWMTQHGAELALTLEMPYAQVHDVEVTPDRLRAFGQALGQAALELVGQGLPCR